MNCLPNGFHVSVLAMIHRTRVLIPAMSMAWLAVMAAAQTSDRWIFEGLITESDPALAPDLQSGWVLSGSFLFNSLEMQAQHTSENHHSGRMTGGVTEGEMTVDLYYQVLFEAFQEPGLAGFDFQDNTIEENGRDLFGWFFPLVGQLGETGWSSTWLQVWLMDTRGEMISHVPVKIPPYGIDWQSGWFRITFANGEGETVHADGRIELFCPESSADAQDATPWYKIAGDLSRQLRLRDRTISLLEEELSDVRSRMEGLSRMVDLLVEERSELQRENELLQEKAAAADPQSIRKLAELTVEKSLLEARIDDLSVENDSLQVELQQSQQERENLRMRLQELELQASRIVVPEPGQTSDVQETDAIPELQVVPAETESRLPAAVPEIAAEATPALPDQPDGPDDVNQAGTPPVPDQSPVRDPENIEDPEEASLISEIQSRRRGPRKFR